MNGANSNGADQQRPPAWISQHQLASIISDAERFAAFLTKAPAVATVNYCGHRYHFWVTLFASMLAGKETLLPPTAQADNIADLLPGQPILAVDDSLVASYCYYSARNAASLHVNAIKVLDQAKAKAHFLTVFTSGSTGAPKPIYKTWQQLANRAASYVGTVFEPAANILAMVPAQHMYGLETSLFTSLLNDFSVHANSTPYPSDVLAATASAAMPVTLVTTPSMLRLLLKAEVKPDNLAAIVSATSPLDAELKEQCQQAFGVAITEIYGFSEAGSVAWRRDEEAWTLLPGLSAQQNAAGDTLILEAGKTIATVEDRVELIDNKTLLLKGRPDDLVKIGGKRASLAGLTQKLQALPELDDGHMIYHAGRESLEAFVVPNEANVATLNSKEIRRRYAQVCDLSFVPRRFTLVEKIPRTATGKVSQAGVATLQKQVRQQKKPVDKGEDAITTIYEVPVEHPAMAGHFPNNPIVPAAVILSYVRHHASNNKLTITEIKRCKFLKLLKPGEAFSITLNPSNGKFSIESSTGVLAKGTALITNSSKQTPTEPASDGC